jgi:hypothetical protein
VYGAVPPLIASVIDPILALQVVLVIVGVIRGGQRGLVIVCVHCAVLPQASVAIYVLVVVSTQFIMFTASLTKVTVGVPQLSLAVTEPGAGAGTVAVQPVRLIVAGQVIVGGVLSTTVITCDPVAVLPQTSVAVHLLVIV